MRGIEVAIFRYRAMDKSGNWQKGVLMAADAGEASGSLSAAGLFIAQLKKQEPGIWQQPLVLPARSVKFREFILFCRQLSIMLKAGVSLLAGLNSLSGQTANRTLKKVLAGIVREIQSGASFSAALKKYPRVFSEIFIGMVEVGESTGSLDEVLEKLAAYYERAGQLRGKIITALAYPAFVSTVAAGVITFLVTFLVPRILQSYSLQPGQLPLITVIVLKASDIIRYRWYIGLVAIFLVYLSVLWQRRQKSIRYRVDRFKLRLPVIGKYMAMSQLAQFSRTFASLYAASIPVLQALSITGGALGNEVYRRIISAAGEVVKEGGRLSAGLRKYPEIPRMMINMLAVGEESGTMDQVLEKVAFYYENDVMDMTDRLQSLLEPVLILIVAGVVGTVVLATMLPIFKLYQNFGGY